MTRLGPKQDRKFMSLALDLAKKSRPSPNPPVGAVVVVEDRVVGSGYHERAGEPHAEINALTDAGAQAKGATLFVTLEPCWHEGKTGPCTEAIHEAGIGRVVVGMVDPDDQVHGQGIGRLRSLGHVVDVGTMEDECAELLAGYIIHRLHGRPLVTLKAAVTLDGYIASNTGDSQWISGPESRSRAHAMRAKSDAVLVGIETVLSDDPLLTVRHVTGLDPMRVVMDSSLRIPESSRLIETAPQTPVLLVHTGADAKRIKTLNAIDGVETLICDPNVDGRVSLTDLLDKLAARGVLSLLVEGGGSVHGSFAKASLADRFCLFIAPKLLGNGRPWVAFKGISNIDDAIALHDLGVTPIGNDLMIEGVFNDAKHSHKI